MRYGRKARGSRKKRGGPEKIRGKETGGKSKERQDKQRKGSPYSPKKKYKLANKKKCKVK